MGLLKVAGEIGSRLGVVEEVEKRQNQDVPNFFMRVKVAFPLCKRQTYSKRGFLGRFEWAEDMGII